jgi:hypothetical protein
MYQYYFHIRDGETFLDDAGLHLPNIDAAKAEALRASSEMLRVVHAEFWQGTPWRLWVTDGPSGTGKTLFTLEFSASMNGGDTQLVV